jgi:hypothetical protein
VRAWEFIMPGRGTSKVETTRPGERVIDSLPSGGECDMQRRAVPNLQQAITRGSHQIDLADRGGVQ